jgi:hypothetical protein
MQPRGEFRGNRSKQIEIKESEIAFFSFPFISPNRDFSMSYGRRNKKNPGHVSGCVQDVSSRGIPPFSPPAGAREGVGFDPFAGRWWP